MAQRGKSIFAQRMKLERENKCKLNSSGSDKILSDPVRVFGERSFIVSGNNAQEIHQENIQKLSQMNPEELSFERQKLISELDPSILEFLRNRRKTVSLVDKNEESMDVSSDTEIHNAQKVGAAKEISELTLMENEDTPLINSAILKPNDDIPLEEAKDLVHKYPHMDIVEKEKLQWTGYLPLEVKLPDDPYPARFNFEGNLLPHSDKGEGILQGLHNHGEEPERPGYTLQELIQLSRSSVLQQRVISLNTLAKIMANASMYDGCFNEPILPALLEADMFLLLRFSLDDPAPPIVMAASSAICNLLVNHIDEACLDSMLGTPLGIQQPSLGVILEMKPNEIDELKDQQLLKLDIIRGALRSDILQRIKFILTDLNPEPVEIKQLLKTLIRISRHSFEMANSVFTCPGLLEAVRSLLDVKNSPSYYPEALKLFRIIASRSHSLALAIFEKYELQKPIFTFIAGEKAAGHPEIMLLTLESFYSWQSCLCYNIGADTITYLSPVIMKLAEAHLGLTNIDGSRSDLEHGAALISTIAVVAKLNFGLVRHILPLLLQATTKWCTQYINILNPKFSASKLLGSCLTLFASTYNDFDSKSVLEPVIEKLLLSTNFTNSIQNLRKCSWLIHGKIISSPENLPCLGSISPTVREESTLPFLYSFAAYIVVSDNSAFKDIFLGHIEILGYIRSILRSDVTTLCGHWYARQELNILVILVHMFTAVEIRENQGMFHKLAFKLLTSVQIGDRALLPDIISKTIFNQKFLSLDVDSVAKKMEDLKLNEFVSTSKINKHLILNESLAALKDIEKLFIRELGFEGLIVPWPPVTLTGILNSTQSALPLDWPFLPIIRLHERQGQDKDSVLIATRSLQWFIIIEELLPDVFSLDYTAKYCRLCCVYLAGSELFQDVSPLLEAALSYVLAHKDKIDFESNIPGLTSFYDFYREVLEQFTGVSYGNSVFGQYVLLPLQQRHSNKYKKLVWSELAAILRLLRTPVDEVDINDYLNPCEADADLLRTYLRCLGTGRVREVWCPVLYKVAVHHVSTYAKNHDNQLAHGLLTLINTMGKKELKNVLLNYSCND
ncbi:RNA polymerase II-associated protein 1 [Halyomorpha halys]|uniref:RNA polymerase II-associated protein 1 n=1 Tax=Halyomorpha halys TaxID=286706 RepID=UPI0006D50B7E|nr:RNA polymerase II-associated protein 1 [Halyomorpha halys]